MPYEQRDHAWLASWGRKDGKTYVVVCLVEHGGHGGEVSGPLVRKVYEYLFGPAPGKPPRAAGAPAPAETAVDPADAGD